MAKVDDDYTEMKNGIEDKLGRLRDVTPFEQSSYTDTALQEKCCEELLAHVRSGDDYISLDNQMTTANMRAFINKYQSIIESDRNASAKLLRQMNDFTSDVGRERSRLSTEQDIERDEANIVNNAIKALKRSNEYVDIQKDYETVNETYNNLNIMAAGRKPKNLPEWPLYLILFALSIIEIAVNWDMFIDWLRLPLLAAGATIFVALAVAFNSDVVGKRAKQMAFLKQSERKNSAALKRTTAFFLLAMVVVFYGRFSYYWTNLGVGSGNLGGGIDWAAIWIVFERTFPTLLINLIIWGIGTVVALFWYDKVPDYRENFREARSLRDKMRAMEANARRQASEDAAREAEKDLDINNAARSRFDRREKEVKGWKSDLQEEFERRVGYAQDQLNRLLARYRKLLVQTDVDGIEHDEVAFKSNAGVHTSGAFRSHDDRIKLKGSL